MTTAEEKRHWDRVRALGCIVTKRTDRVTLHHVHSGSIARMGINRGSTRSNHWLVIPLHPDLHCVGPHAIDGSCGVLTWEMTFGTQVEHLDRVSRLLGYNVWKRGGVEREVRGVE